MYTYFGSEAIEGHILLTGATGLLGRHMLYELMRMKAEGRLSGHIYTLIQPKNGQDAHKRLHHLLRHPMAPDYLWDLPEASASQWVHALEGSLNSPALSAALSKIPDDRPLYIVHNASSVNLSPGEAAYADIEKNAYEGTLRLLKALPMGKHPRKFTFVSTAYSCGRQSEPVTDNYTLLTAGQYRNAYEMFKAKLEKEVINFCQGAGINWQILRPSIIVGRVMDAPLYYVSKYDVVYGWTKFFHKIKQAGPDGFIRILVHNDAFVNMIPVDYAAKVMTAVFADDSISWLNIVNPHDMLCRDVLTTVLGCVDYTAYEFVEQAPEWFMNKYEKLYYKTVGAVFEPYITSPTMQFDTSNFREICGHLGLATPDIEGELEHLLDFAVCCGFKEPKPVQKSFML